MKVLLSVCLLLCLALSVNSVRVRTHTKSHTTTSQTWQPYVDQALIGAGMSGGVILGADGSIYAISAGFPLGSNGFNLVKQFASPQTAVSQGITLGTTKYSVAKADGKSISGTNGAKGIVMMKTSQVVVVGTYGTNLKPAAATQIVQRLADYLRENGY